MSKEYVSEFPAYAFPGGYPLYYLTKDNCVVCPKCAANDHSDYVKRILTLFCDWCMLTPDEFADDYGEKDIDESEYTAIAVAANYEDDSLHCDNCSKRIESAYSED